jgi:hypothetical protein
MIKVKKLLPGGLLTPGMRAMVKAAKNIKMKSTPVVAKEQYDMIDTARKIVQKGVSTVNNKKIDTDFLSDKDQMFKDIATGLAKQKKAKMFQTLSEKALESPKVSAGIKESLKETIPKLKEYNNTLVKKVTAIMEKDIAKPTMQRSGGFIDMTKDKKYYKGML